MNFRANTSCHAKHDEVDLQFCPSSAEMEWRVFVHALKLLVLRANGRHVLQVASTCLLASEYRDRHDVLLVCPLDVLILLNEDR